jgi:hypothetical protein
MKKLISWAIGTGIFVVGYIFNGLYFITDLGINYKLLFLLVSQILTVPSLMWWHNFISKKLNK